MLLSQTAGGVTLRATQKGAGLSSALEADTEFRERPTHGARAPPSVQLVYPRAHSPVKVPNGILLSE